MFIKPGVAMVIVSINLSLSFIIGASCSASSMGYLLLILDKTIATLVEMSQLNFGGGISVFIPVSYTHLTLPTKRIV